MSGERRVFERWRDVWFGFGVCALLYAWAIFNQRIEDPVSWLGWTGAAFIGGSLVFHLYSKTLPKEPS